MAQSSDGSRPKEAAWAGPPRLLAWAAAALAGLMIGAVIVPGRLDAQTETPPLPPALRRGGAPPSIQPSPGAAGVRPAPRLTNRQLQAIAGAGQAEEPVTRRRIRIDQAIAWALSHNPDILLRRRDLGIARAQVVIADTYPYNPVFETTLQGADNVNLKQHIRQAYTLLQEVEIAGQGKYRRADARAALERTGWEIRQQELTLAVQVARAFQALLYRQRKLDLAHSTTQLNTRLIDQVRGLFNANLVTRSDLILAQAEAADSRRAESAARVALHTAQVDFRTALGIVNENVRFVPEGELGGAGISGPTSRFVEQAFRTRPDLRARRAAIREAEAALRLACANQTPNVTLGPAIEIDEAKTFFGGATISLPLYVWNQKRGDVLLARAQLLKALTDLDQTRIRVRLEVAAALEAYRDTQEVVRAIQGDVIPKLEQNLKDTEELFAAGQVNLLQLVDLRRRLLMARDQLLDILNELALGGLQVTSATGRPLFAAAPATRTTP